LSLVFAFYTLQDMFIKSQDTLYHSSVPRRCNATIRTKQKMRLRISKALSPVVASIILIAVTVAISIAVGAWTGALTFGFTSTEQIRITSMTFDVPNNVITVTVNNPGTSYVTINEAWVNEIKQTNTNPNLPYALPANSKVVFNITTAGLYVGHAYTVRLISAKGNEFLYTANT
jgi:flagellin-like protein